MDITIKDIITLIQAVGFPIFIAVWFLLRTEKIIQSAENALNRLIVIEEREIEVLRVVMIKYGIDESEFDAVRLAVKKERKNE